MHTSNLRKVGGSVMLAVPPALLDVLQLTAGAKVGMTVDNGRLIVEAVARPRYTMEELLAASELVKATACRGMRVGGRPRDRPGDSMKRGEIYKS